MNLIQQVAIGGVVFLVSFLCNYHEMDCFTLLCLGPRTGSRTDSLLNVPKPLIVIDGKPLFDCYITITVRFDVIHLL